MQDGTISNGQISASSERRKDFRPANARLNFSGTGVRVGAWVAGETNSNQWLQVDFGNVTIVTGIGTQGRTWDLCDGCENWVKKYKVSYSLDNATFPQYKENGSKVKVHIVSVLSVLRIPWLFHICFSLFSPHQRNSEPTRTETPSSVTCWVPPLWRGTSASILQTGAVTSPWGWSSGDAEQVWVITLPPPPPPPPPLQSSLMSAG